ncbi:MAG: COX15/CtaA family protein [Candidatus Acidiferrales bacterium]
MAADQIESAPSAAYRLAVTTVVFIVLLLVAGALVTSNNAADSVPDWPLAYGKLIPPLVGGIRFEYSHRVIAAIVSILTLILAFTLAFGKSSAPPRHTRVARRLGWLALALVIVQAGLGGLRVLEGYPAIIATAHAILAQLFFITVVSLAIFISPWWQRDLPALNDSSSPRLNVLAVATACAIVIQLVLGAGFRHGAWGILPHLIFFLVVTFMVIWVGRAAKSRFRGNPDLRRATVLLHSTFGTQVLLGIGAFWATARAISAAQPTLPYVLLTVAHVLVGALVLASSVLLALTSFRLTRPAPAVSTVPASRSTAENSSAHVSGAAAS